MIFTPLENPVAWSGDEDKIPLGANKGFLKPCVSHPVGRSKPSNGVNPKTHVGFTFISSEFKRF